MGSSRRGNHAGRLEDLPAIAQMAERGARFVLWRWATRDGKPTKLPVRINGLMADSTKAVSWATLAECEAAAPGLPNIAGVGFVLASELDTAAGQLAIVGTDLDGCRDPDTGTIKRWAAKIITALASYAEVSPSGTGVKVFCFVDPLRPLAAHKRVVRRASNGAAKDEAVEIYTGNRYFCLTSQRLENTPDEIVDATEAFERLAAWIARGGKKTKGTAQVDTAPPSDVTIRLIERTPSLARLWRGEKGEGDTTSSGLDCSLACALGAAGVEELEIGRALSHYPHGQIGGGKLKGAAAARQLTKLLRKAEEARPNGEVKPNGEAEWPEPRPLPAGLPDVAPFDYALLPRDLRPWVKDVAERMQCPPDYPAVGVMVALSAAIGRRITIRPKQVDSWTVVPNLWGGCIGDPGWMKTPAMEEALKPLVRLEAEAKVDHELRMKVHEAETRLEAIEKKVREKAVEAALKSKADRDRAGLIADLMEGCGNGRPPGRVRYLVNDATVEKLGEILVDNPYGVLVFRDELTGWIRGLDREGREQDRAFYLQGWAGGTAHTSDRIVRGTTDVGAVCISMFGSIPPGPLVAYLGTMRNGGTADDGLVQRFQMLVWPTPHPEWVDVDRLPYREARDRAFALFRRAVAINPAEHGAETEEGEPPFVRFAPDAQAHFVMWRRGLEKRLRTGDLHPAFAAHLAKFRSLVPSLALVSHVAEGTKGPVSLASCVRAIAWAEYLESHATRVYSVLLRSCETAANELGKHLLAGHLGSVFSARSVQRRGWAGLTDKETVAEALDLLEELSWVRSAAIKPAGGGRPTTEYTVNPKIGEAGK